jgi:hypothetical protein
MKRLSTFGLSVLSLTSSVGVPRAVVAEELDLTRPQREILDKFWSEHEHDADVRRWDSETYGNANYWNSLVVSAGSPLTHSTVQAHAEGEMPPL